MRDDKYYGIGNFKVGDVVSVIMPAKYDSSDNAFGIHKTRWEKAVSHGAFTISSVVDSPFEGEWAGYRFEEYTDLETDYSYIWPAWGMELVHFAATEVEDLL